MAVGVTSPPKARRRPPPASDPGADGAIDARVASHGGHRKSRKANYEFAGMIDDASWSRTRVHPATSFYGCALCGQGFRGPHAVYTHLAKVHDR